MITLKKPLTLDNVNYSYLVATKYSNGNIALFLNVDNDVNYLPTSLKLTTNLGQLISHSQVLLDSNNLGDELDPIVKNLQDNKVLGKFKGDEASGFVDDYKLYDLKFDADKEFEKNRQLI